MFINVCIHIISYINVCLCLFIYINNNKSDLLFHVVKNDIFIMMMMIMMTVYIHLTDRQYS